MYIKHMEETRDRMRGSFVRQRQNSDSDEKRKRLRRFFVKPKSELQEDVLMPQVALGMRIWNMKNHLSVCDVNRICYCSIKEIFILKYIITRMSFK